MNEIQQLSINNGDILVSFDVSSLFTNVPLEETIQLLTDKAFTNNWFNETYQLHLSRQDLVDRLRAATKDQLFIFNGRLYEQTRGVAMGSPLGLLLANVFMCSIEERIGAGLMCLCVVLKKGLEQEGKMLAYYRRSVDDTLTVMPNKTCAENILETLNRCHSSVMFTMENESNGYFPSWAPSSSTDHHVWRPKSMLSPRTLASCCITRATQTLDINGRYQKLYLIVLSDFRPTGRISPKNAIVLNYLFSG